MHGPIAGVASKGLCATRGPHPVMTTCSRTFAALGITEKPKAAHNETFVMLLTEVSGRSKDDCKSEDVVLIPFGSEDINHPPLLVDRPNPEIRKLPLELLHSQQNVLGVIHRVRIRAPVST